MHVCRHTVRDTLSLLVSGKKKESLSSQTSHNFEVIIIVLNENLNTVMKLLFKKRRHSSSNCTLAEQ